MTPAEATAAPSGLLAATPLLDFAEPRIRSLIEGRGWLALSEHERIGAAYDFVRDEIAFGYNASDDLPASQVLADGIGQCNTKSTLFMALLRGLGIACRFHGFTIDKGLQKGAISGLAYALAPRSILHSWVEVWYAGRWVELEGFILDRAYLGALQRRFAGVDGPFCGFGVATADLHDPPIDWQGSDTYIQKDGINADLGIHDDPDSFYRRHGVNLSGLRRWLFQHLIRHGMNRTVARLRGARSAAQRVVGPAS